MIKEYLKQTVEFSKRAKLNKLGDYISIYDFILQNGLYFKIKPLPKGIIQGKMKECYKNAALLSLEKPNYFYAEGIACGIIPVLHAWCVDKDKNVIDPTWSDGKEYFGVIIKKGFLFKQVEKCGFGLIDDWKNRWPLLTLDKKIWKEVI